MSTRIGRPLSDNPKGKRIGVRLDNDSLDILEKCCEKLNKSKSETIRLSINLLAEKLSKSE